MKKLTEKQAIAVLEKGGVIIYPTDTLVGIGCRADQRKAVERVFAIKKRPLTMAVPVLVASPARVMDVVAEIPSHARLLMKRYWPGGLTIILPAKEDATALLVRAGGRTVSVRQPHHPQLLSLLEHLPFPLVGTSANLHGEPAVARIQDVDSDIIQAVDGVFDGAGGMGVESTIVDCTKNPSQLVRKGAVHVRLPLD